MDDKCKTALIALGFVLTAYGDELADEILETTQDGTIGDGLMAKLKYIVDHPDEIIDPPDFLLPWE